MPHVNGTMDIETDETDEVKVFQHDEECEEEKKLLEEERKSDSLTEDKSSLINEGEIQVKKREKKKFWPFFFLFFLVVRVGRSGATKPRRSARGAWHLFF